MKLHRSFLAALLLPTLLVADINPPRIKDGPNSTSSSMVTIIAHVDFVDPPISTEMSLEEIEEATEGHCFINPKESTAIICQ